MNQHRFWKIITPLFAVGGMCLGALTTARGQAVSLPGKDATYRSTASAENTREETAVHNGKQGDEGIRKAIIIGFVGGFVKHDDPKHPEVQFAAYLRDRYSSGVYAEVFSNHYGHKALSQVLRLLDIDHDGVLSTAEKQHAKIIIYGHSWGASEAVWLAGKLEQEGIPVLLTIQVDLVSKFRQKSSTIPPNVTDAVNFYQSRGPLHGHSEILAADPARTKIIGNFHMTYKDHPVNCDNYRWWARVFDKPHHEIENDPRVWDQAASLIDSRLANTGSTAQASSPSKSPFFNFLYGRRP